MQSNFTGLDAQYQLLLNSYMYPFTYLNIFTYSYKYYTFLL